MFRIEPATAYSKDYSTCIEQAKCDQKRDARPALAVYPRGLEQYDAIYKKLADGEITLIQFSEDNNDPTKDLTELANTKVTFVE